MPNPLAPGHIEGQNPETPERLPGHTADPSVTHDRAFAANEEDLGGRPAFLFRAGDMAGVTLDTSGANLPLPEGSARWVLSRQFTLGVRDAGVLGLNPEPLIRGIASNGFYVWRPSDPSRTEGSYQ